MKRETTQVTNIDQYLKGVNFPADRNELERVAKQNNAPNEVMDGIRRLPDQRFNSQQDVTRLFPKGGR